MTPTTKQEKVEVVEEVLEGKKEVRGTRFMEDLKSAKRVCVPLVVACTSDPIAVMEQVRELTGQKEGLLAGTALVRWDSASGITAFNGKGVPALHTCLEEAIKAKFCEPGADLRRMFDLGGAVKVLRKLPSNTILFALNAHRFIGSKTEKEAIAGQALWNLRDEYKRDYRMVCLLVPEIELPAELRQDVLVLDDPLPTSEDLSKLLDAVYKSSHDQKPEFPEKPSSEEKDKAVETVKGLSIFAAEQSYFMSLNRDGIDLEKLWHRKKKSVENTQGLSVYAGTETFADVEGLEAIKEYLTNFFYGEEPPTVIVFLDEIEKMFSGLAGDTSGVSQDQHGEFLRWTQDYKVLGSIFVGHPGCSKSFLAKACAGEFKVPMVELNISALKAGIVGQTGTQTRAAFKTISAIGRPFIIATSNSLGILPPELKRRFRCGTWFFSLPSKPEREAIWDLYMKKYKLQRQPMPDDNHWTPDEIHTCCNTAWRLKCSLLQASKYIVSTYKADPTKVEELCLQAHNRFLSASHSGVYTYERDEPETDKVMRGLHTDA